LGNIKLDAQSIVAILSFLVALGGFLFTYFGYILRQQKAMSDQKFELITIFTNKTDDLKKEFYDEHNKITTELKDKFTGFENQVIARLVAVETKTALFWKVVEDGVIDMIKQPIHVEKDTLLEAFKADNKNISGDNLAKLKFMLEDELAELKIKKDPKVMYYVIMLARIEQVMYDKQCGCVK
jgi:hypothetical protein